MSARDRASSGVLTSVEAHLAQCLALVRPLPPIDLALLDCLGCVLAVDVVAGHDVPAFDNSSMDGYAVHVDDVASATTDAPVTLPVVGDVPAGSREHLRLNPGTAIRIMTGAPVPRGTGGIVPVEDTDGGVATVTITAPTARGRHVRRIGEDVASGHVVLASGTRIGPAQLAALAATGHDRARVHPRPRVVVVSTGNELVEPGTTPGFGQVSDVNGYALTAAVRTAGGVAYRVAAIGDDDQEVAETLQDQLVRADIVVTTGGVSAGAYDTVKEVLSRTGTVDFTKVAMQPGMPQGVGVLGEDRVPVFTLPGNPVSALVSFEVFLRPVLHAMTGRPPVRRGVVTATVTTGWRSPAGKRQFSRAALTATDDGWTVAPAGGPGSHLVTDLARADCLALVDADVTEVARGDRLECWLLDGSGD